MVIVKDQSSHLVYLKITNCEYFNSIGRRSSEINMRSNVLVRNYLFLKNYVTSESAVSHNVLYYQLQLLATR